MTQVASSGLFWTQFRVSRDFFTDLTAGKATVRTFLPRLLTAASRIQNCTYRTIITHQTPQSNLPIVIDYLTPKAQIHVAYASNPAQCCYGNQGPISVMIWFVILFNAKNWFVTWIRWGASLTVSYGIETWKKWSMFCRWHYKCNFLIESCLKLTPISLKPLTANWQ